MKESYQSFFVLFLSWGPPHAPYHTAPKKYRNMFKPDNITLPPNVPLAQREWAKKRLAGYYAHIAALDDCMGDLMKTIDRSRMKDNTILVFTSDHGDMIGSHGQSKKQRPWDESIRVPFLIRFPKKLGSNGKVIDMPFGTPDIMPTLLGLSGIDVPLLLKEKIFQTFSLTKKTLQTTLRSLCVRLLSVNGFALRWAGNSVVFAPNDIPMCVT